MRNLDKHLGLFMWALFAVISLAMMAPFVVALLSADDELRWLLVVAIFVIPFAVCAPVVLCMAIIVRRSLRSPAAQVLEALRSQLGGTILMPSLWQPVLQPRLVTEWRGGELEVRLFRARAGVAGHLLAAYAENDHARFGFRVWGWTWRLAVYWARPIPFKLNAVSRTKVASWGAGLVGMHEIVTGQPEVDRRLVIVTNDRHRAQPFLADGAFAATLDQAIAVNAPFIGNVAFGPPTSLSPGTFFVTPMSEQMDLARIEWLLERLDWLTRTLASGPAGHRQERSRPAS
jgi:hypothetical protein